MIRDLPFDTETMLAGLKPWIECESPTYDACAETAASITEHWTLTIPSPKSMPMLYSAVGRTRTFWRRSCIGYHNVVERLLSAASSL